MKFGTMMIGYWHHRLFFCPSLRPSVTLCIGAKRYILRQKCLNRCGKCSVRNTILLLSTPYTVPISSIPDLLNHRLCCHLANTLKHAANIFAYGIAIVGMLHGYSRQCNYTSDFVSNSWASYIVKLQLYS